MMRLNRVHWLMRFGSRPIHPRRGTGPTWGLLRWFERHGIIRFVWKVPDLILDHAEVTEKGRADLAHAVGEHRDHGTFRPLGVR